MTEAELRRAFPKASRWWVKLIVALQREGAIEFRVPRSEVESAVMHKLFGGAKGSQRQAIKAAASLALDQAIRPRRTGKLRGRPSLHVDRVIAEIHACFRGDHYFDEPRLERLVLAHLKPATPYERRAVIRDLQMVTERQGRGVDWCAWLRKWRKTLAETHAD